MTRPISPWCWSADRGGGHERRASERGKLFIIGLGPGPDKWLAPEASAALAEADALIGYKPYTRSRAASAPGWSVSRPTIASRSTAPAMRLQLAGEGRKVAVVSGGDPGVFAMAAAVLEAVEAGDPTGARSTFGSCRASAPCRRRRRGSARRSAMISA